MNDLRSLHEAFGELERRADAATVTAAPAPRRTSRLVPVAATVVVVAGLAAGAVWLVPGDNAGTQAGSPPTSTSPPTSPPSAQAAPQTPDELIARFTDVLGDMATLNVTWKGPGAYEVRVPDSSNDTTPPDDGDAKGAAITGTLTAGGVTGGFDLLTYPALPSDKPSCEGQDPGACTVSTLPDGATMRVDAPVDLEGGGVTHHVVILHADGNLFEMHVSNRASPKGQGGTLGTQPPLTTDQIISILTSDRW
jgi:hypothetical protein